MEHDPTGGSGRVGSGRVGSNRIGLDRIGSGLVWSGRVGSGQEVFQMSRVGSDRVRMCSKCHGSGRIGSGGVPNVTDRVGSGQEFSSATADAAHKKRQFEIHAESLTLCALTSITSIIS